MIRRPLPLAALALLVTLLAGAPSQANVYDIYGFSPRAIGRGGAMTAVGEDYTSTYYNPGALTAGKQVRMGLGLHITVPDLYVERTLEDADKGAILPEPSTSFSLGWLYPLGGIFDDRLAVAISLTLPSGRIARVQGFDPQAPHYYMFQNLHDKMLLHAAIAWEPVDGLSVGLGMQTLSDLSGHARLHLDVLDGRFELRDFGVELEPTLSALAGLHLRPAPGLSLGLTWRETNALSFQLPVVVQEGELFSLTLDVSQTVLYTPQSIAFGLGYEIPGADLLMGVDLTLALWSAAPDPSPHIVGDVGGDLVEGLGLGSALDLSLGSEPAALGFVDTVTPRAGFEWTATDWLALRTGYGFRPTPAPPQTGTTAYLDNDAHLVGLGAGFTFMDPLRVHIHPITVDVALLAILLPRRSVVRTAPADPIGGLGHGGTVWSFSIAVNHAY